MRNYLSSLFFSRTICRHRNTGFPVTDHRDGLTYQRCNDCGRRARYDASAMRVVGPWQVEAADPTPSPEQFRPPQALRKVVGFRCRR